MASVAKFADDIAYLFPDAGAGIIQEAVLNAVETFLIDTNMATDFLTITLEAGQSDYLLLLPECRQLVRVTKVRYQQSANVMHPRELAFELIGNAEALRIMHTNAFSSPAGCYPEPCKTACAPECADVVEVDYSWTINGTTCEIPEHLFGLNRQALINLVRYYMHRMDKQEWSDLNLSDRAMVEYRDALETIKIRIMRKFTNKPLKLAGNRSSMMGNWNTTTSGRR